jgi:hypothetical protein
MQFDVVEPAGSAHGELVDHGHERRSCWQIACLRARILQSISSFLWHALLPSRNHGLPRTGRVEASRDSTYESGHDARPRAEAGAGPARTTHHRQRGALSWFTLPSLSCSRCPSLHPARWRPIVHTQDLAQGLNLTRLDECGGVFVFLKCSGSHELPERECRPVGLVVPLPVGCVRQLRQLTMQGGCP